MIKFGTGGWRAEIGKEFNMENIRKISQGLANHIKRKKLTNTPVIIGYDRRFLSDSAAKWMAEVFSANKIKVIFLRRSAPTPLIMHYVKTNNLYFGFEVTASHNPSNYNGIKVIVKEGRDPMPETTAVLEESINSVKPESINSIPFEEGVKNKTITYLENPFNSFLDDILELLDTDAIRKRGLRILFDPMHGSSAYPLMVILHTARCTVDIINGNRDAYFGGTMPAPTESTLKSLAQQVVDGNYDLGIGVDGDGDRLGIIDSNGQYINANEILALLYYYLHEYKGWKGPVVRNLATTHLLDKIASDFGEECYEVPVGFKYISSKIDQVNAILGGESSGGLTVRGHIHGKDSVYSASLFVEMISKTGKTPSELLKKIYKKYGSFIMVEENIRMSEDAKDRIFKTVMEERIIPEFNQKITAVSYEDGCKIYFEDASFVICRFSGTEPLLRIFAESSSKDRATELINNWKDLLKL